MLDLSRRSTENIFSVYSDVARKHRTHVGNLSRRDGLLLFPRTFCPFFLRGLALESLAENLCTYLQVPHVFSLVEDVIWLEVLHLKAGVGACHTCNCGNAYLGVEAHLSKSGSHVSCGWDSSQVLKLTALAYSSVPFGSTKDAFIFGFVGLNR